MAHSQPLTNLNHFRIKIILVIAFLQNSCDLQHDLQQDLGLALLSIHDLLT